MRFQSIPLLLVATLGGALFSACSSSSDNDSGPGAQDAAASGTDAQSRPADAGFPPDAATDAMTADRGAAADAQGTVDAAPAPDSGTDKGNILIADQFNNRVIEIARTGTTATIVWSFGTGSSTAGPNAVVAPNDAERVSGGKTLISGTGAPQNAEPTCPGPNGCQDDRVLLVDQSGAITWQYGQAGVSGSDANQLNTPVCSVMLPSGNVLITDQGNQRIIEVTMAKDIVWQYGTTSSASANPNHLNNPNSAERLPNGNTLIADENNNRVIEVTPAKQIVWQYPQTPDTTKLNGAAFASRLPNGNTLITDSNNNRIIEVTMTGTVTWSFTTNTRPDSNPMPLPTRGVRLANGHTLISDQFNHQVIEVDGTGTVVFSYGRINVPGMGAGALNAPYDAKVVGDYTGMTVPF